MATSRPPSRRLPAFSDVADHPAEPVRISGGFGSGKTTALRARAERLGVESVLFIGAGATSFVDVGLGILRRFAAVDGLIGSDDQAALFDELLAGADPSYRAEAMAAVVAYEASFLGREELRVHADAAGQLARWERLADLAEAYLAVLAERRLVDSAGAVVQASLLLRDDEVATEVRSRFDHVLVDDAEGLTFATARLLAQLTGPGTSVTVAGNPNGPRGDDPFASGQHLERFARRFGATLDIELPGTWRRPGPPELHIGVHPDVDDGEALLIPCGSALDFVGQEAATVVVTDATDDVVPGEWRPPRWFDVHLMSGPDVPSIDDRINAHVAEQRRRFGLACSRATRRLVIVASPPVTRFIADLVA